jgi:2'-5' RNA ligase
MGESIRTFIALELDDSLRRKIADVRTQLERDRAARYVKWVAVDNIHITLKFLGDVESGKLPELQRAIATACEGTPPFTLTLVGVGTFPNTRRPNIVWVGAEGQIEIATKLAERIDDACAVLGYAREARPFTPHLTIGRVKRDASTNDRKFIGEMITTATVGALGELRVDQVTVMKSELRPMGSVYTRLMEIRLTDDGRRMTE